MTGRPFCLRPCPGPDHAPSSAMDQFLLHAVAAEASRRLLEQEILRVSSLGQSRYLLRFATASKDNLLLSVRPDLPRFHLLDARRVTEGPPDRFAARSEERRVGKECRSRWSPYH